MQENDKGKKEIKKLGLAPVQKSGIDFEFTIAGDLDIDHRMLISKSRADTIAVGEVIDRPGEVFAKRLRAWLDDGAEPIATSVAGPVTAALDDVFARYLADIESAPDLISLDRIATGPGRTAKGTPNYDRAVQAYLVRKALLEKAE